MKNNRFIFIIFGICLLIPALFWFSKSDIPNAISETTTQLQLTTITVSQAATESEPQTITALFTQLITEITTKEASTAKTETTKNTTVKATEKKTEKSTQTTKAPALTKPVPPDFQLQIPTLKLPDLVPPVTEKTTKSNVKADLSCFDNSVFIGNSRFVSFKNYGLAKNVYSVVGLNVDTVFTKSVSGSNVTVINELNGKNFDKVILMFGDNECGWPNQNVFIDRYAKVIAAVRERIPDAEIYLHAILPVSAEASAKSNYGCNNPTINALNEKIRQLAADEGIKFIEQPPCLKDTDGALLPEAASDGIHLNKKYSEIWLDYLAKTII